MDDSDFTIEALPPGDYRGYRIYVDDNVPSISRGGTGYFISDDAKIILISPNTLRGENWDNWFKWHVKQVKKELFNHCVNSFNDLRFKLGIKWDYSEFNTETYSMWDEAEQVGLTYSPKLEPKQVPIVVA
mgnify:CR=1 FL=1